ncbi:MAG: hypothetical protein H6704_18310 [Myxococcales bacterium]|nr:hypothetical protein [Myxococcales bacterium]
MPTLGFGPTVFDLPGVGGLAPALARAGHRVHALPGDDEAGLVERLRGLRDGGRRLVGIGHGWGGAQILRALAAGAALDALVLIGAPLAFGGEQRAVQALWARRPARWGDLPAPLARRLLTVGLPERVRRPLLDHATAPLAPILDRWQRRAAGRVVPAPDAELDILARFAGPTLCVSSPTDALFPPHVCDPAAFGPPLPRVEHRLVAPVDGVALRYGHLDLVAHPAARSTLDPIFEAWLAEHRAPSGAPQAGLLLESEPVRR